MGASTSIDEDQPTMLPARMDLGSFAQLAQKLRGLHGPDIVLDAQHVTHFGAIGLQLLLAARKTAMASGGNLTVLSPSAAFSTAVRDFGLLGDLFGGLE